MNISKSISDPHESYMPGAGSMTLLFGSTSLKHQRSRPSRTRSCSSELISAKLVMLGSAMWEGSPCKYLAIQQPIISKLNTTENSFELWQLKEAEFKQPDANQSQPLALIGEENRKSLGTRPFCQKQFCCWLCANPWSWIGCHFTQHIHCPAGLAGSDQVHGLCPFQNDASTANVGKTWDWGWRLYKPGHPIAIASMTDELLIIDISSVISHQTLAAHFIAMHLMVNLNL